jgi:hypothetical protein
MRLDLQPPSGSREQSSLRRVAAARVEVPSRPPSGPHRELPGGALGDTPLARMLARAVQQRVPTSVVDRPHATVARAPSQAQGASAVAVAGGGTASDRAAFIDFWTEIEMDVGSSQAPEELYASFVRNAQAVEDDPTFYPVVQDMYGQIDDLIAAYADGFTIDQMADSAGF